MRFPRLFSKAEDYAPESVRALIGKEQGDSVEVVTPGGQRSYEILAVRYR